MDLFEYQGREYFARFDLPVPKGDVADTVDQAVEVAERSGYPVVIKAQVQVGGRGKAGGVKLGVSAAALTFGAIYFGGSSAFSVLLLFQLGVTR